MPDSRLPVECGDVVFARSRERATTCAPARMTGKSIPAWLQARSAGALLRASSTLPVSLKPGETLAILTAHYTVRGAVFELLREGQRVEFTQEESGKGPRAGEVRLIEN